MQLYSRTILQNKRKWQKKKKRQGPWNAHRACRQNLQLIHEPCCKTNGTTAHSLFVNHQPSNPAEESSEAPKEEEARRSRKKRHQPNEFSPPKTSTKATTHAFAPSRATPQRASSVPLLAVCSPRGRRAGRDRIPLSPWRRASGGGSPIRSSPPPSAYRTPPTGKASLSPLLPALICCLVPESRARL